MSRDWTGDLKWALSMGARLVVVGSLSAICLAIADPTALGELGLTLPRILLAYVGAWLVVSTICGLGRPYLSSLLGCALAGLIGGAAAAIATNIADYRPDMTDYHRLEVFVFALIGAGMGIAIHFRLKQRSGRQ
jgi:membrane associated rhomboid family serine protease